jgi:phosphate-selective porin OprO and OprP
MKRALLVSTAILGGLVGSPAFADDEAMMRQLKAMQAQMNQMQTEMNRLQKELAETKAQHKAANKLVEDTKLAKANPANDVKISMVPAPKFETADGNYSFKVGGFAQVDGGVVKDDRRDHTDGTNIRRARLNVSGVIAKDFKYKIENDFAGNVSALTDVYLEYAGWEPVSLMVGQFKEPFGLETLTSDLFTTFIERSSTTVFSPDRKIGVQVASYGTLEPLGSWTAALGGFGSGTNTPGSTDDEARDITGRLTLAPFASKTEVLHFGVAASHRVPDQSTTLNETVTLSARAENNLSNAAADASVSSAVTFVDDMDLFGLEAAGVYGPFSLQAEYVDLSIQRNNALPDVNFGGYYVEASYFLTGESRNYNAKQGRFDRVAPKWQFSPKEGQWGAWQIAARQSYLDLSDGTFRGGEMRNTTLGLRWIPHSNLSLTANYIMSHVNDSSVAVNNEDPDIFIMRAQFDF